MGKLENTTMTTQEDQFDDDFSLFDLVAFIRRNLLRLLGGTLIGGVLGLIIAFILPAQWEANALIRIGQLDKTENFIELPLQSIDRIKNKSFQNDVLKNLGMEPDEEDPIAKVFRNTLKVKKEKSDLLNLTIRGMSPDEAKSHMEAVISQLKNIHLDMAAPTIKRWHQELKSIQEELKKADFETQRLTKSLNERTDKVNEKSFPQVAMLSGLLLTREVELRNLQEQKRIFEEHLSPDRTFATKELGRIEVSARPVFPKKSLFAAAGLAIGLLFGVLLANLLTLGSRKGA